MTLRRLVAIAWMLAGCGEPPRAPVAPPVDTNAAPIAEAGEGGDHPLGATITVDASASHDPDGTVVGYRWRVSGRPADSISQLSQMNAPVTTLVLDQVGEYELEVTVTDDAGATSYDRVSVWAIAPRLGGIDAGPDQVHPWRSAVRLGGSVDAPDGLVPTVVWELTSVPAGSVAQLDDTSSLTPGFQLDREGTYTARLTAQTPYETITDEVTVTATVTRHYLDYIVVDGVYSPALDRFVLASDLPPRLRVYDPRTQVEQAVTLPDSPISVALALDGTRAVVAHINSVTIVDLTTPAVVVTHPVPVTVHGVVFGPGDRVHVMHTDVNPAPIIAVDIATGATTENPWRWPRGGLDARLHPSGTVAYAVTNLIPSDLERYELTPTSMTFARESPYHGTHELGDNLWFTADGTRVITRSGNVFRTSTDAMFDMTYVGTLGLDDRASVAHAPANGQLAVLRTEYDGWNNPSEFYLDTHDDVQLTLERSILLPNTPVGAITLPSAGRFVAYSADATQIYVIVRAGAAPGSTHALYTFEP